MPRTSTWRRDRKSTRLNSSHGYNSYAVFCLKKKKDLLEAVAALNGADDLLEGELALAADDEVGVLQPLLGEDVRMAAAEHHEAADRADVVGKEVRLRSRGGDGRDAHQVRRHHFVHVGSLDVLDVDADVVALVTYYFDEPPGTEICTLTLHDALPI